MTDFNSTGKNAVSYCMKQETKFPRISVSSRKKMLPIVVAQKSTGSTELSLTACFLEMS